MLLELLTILLTFIIVTSSGAQEITISSETTHAQTVTTLDENESKPTSQQFLPSVFSPQFMKNLLTCKADIESDDERQLKIIGIEKERCYLQYANFDLSIPLVVLGNIHSFDDIETLLKNKDFTTYKYRADYIYDGLIYALTACAKKKDYYGKAEELIDEYVTINRGLSAEFSNNNCIINLYNQQNIEGIVTDYGVTCTLAYATVIDLQNYFKNITDKYGEKREFDRNGRITVTGEQQNNETHDADVALMYYLQQNGYCQKNTP